MAAILKLRSTPASLSAGRQKLAEAIAEQREAAARMAALGTLLDRARAERVVAEGASEAARKIAAGAPQAAVRHATDRLLGLPTVAPPSAAEARARLEDAEAAETAAVEVARAAIAELQALADHVSYRAVRVRMAACAVLREEAVDPVDALVSELRDLQQKMVDRGRLLTWLVHREAAFTIGPRATSGVSDVMQNLQWPIVKSGAWNAAGTSASEAAWEEAFATLLLDAGAALPGG